MTLGAPYQERLYFLSLTHVCVVSPVWRTFFASLLLQSRSLLSCSFSHLMPVISLSHTHARTHVHARSKSRSTGQEESTRNRSERARRKSFRSSLSLFHSITGCHSETRRGLIESLSTERHSGKSTVRRVWIYPAQYFPFLDYPLKAFLPQSHSILKAAVYVSLSHFYVD